MSFESFAEYYLNCVYGLSHSDDPEKRNKYYEFVINYYDHFIQGKFPVDYPKDLEDIGTKRMSYDDFLNAEFNLGKEEIPKEKCDAADCEFTRGSEESCEATYASMGWVLPDKQFRLGREQNDKRQLKVMVSTGSRKEQEVIVQIEGLGTCKIESDREVVLECPANFVPKTMVIYQREKLIMANISIERLNQRKEITMGVQPKRVLQEINSCSVQMSLKFDTSYETEERKLSWDHFDQERDGMIKDFDMGMEWADDVKRVKRIRETYTVPKEENQEHRKVDEEQDLLTVTISIDPPLKAEKVAKDTWIWPAMFRRPCPLVYIPRAIKPDSFIAMGEARRKKK